MDVSHFPRQDRSLRLFLWVCVFAVFLWTGWKPADRFTWFMEVVPVIVGAFLLLAFYPHWHFSRLVSCFLCLHAIVLMIGGHYTYAEVPLFNWIRDHYHLARNDYDRLGHLMQGFVPALVSREILLRRGILKRGPWLTFIVLCICMAISASYELLEWQTAVWTGTKADAFLGSQGDPWDTQWDMCCALIGATLSLLLMPPLQDKEIARLS
jgi:putative membrane protein